MTMLCPDECNPTRGHVDGCPRLAPKDKNAPAPIVSTLTCPEACTPETGHAKHCDRYVEKTEEHEHEDRRTLGGLNR